MHKAAFVIYHIKAVNASGEDADNSAMEHQMEQAPHLQRRQILRGLSITGLSFLLSLAAVFAAQWYILPAEHDTAAQTNAASEPASAETETVFSFGKRRTDCAQWTDGCHICSAVACSTASISCRQTKTTCVRLK